MKYNESINQINKNNLIRCLITDEVNIFKPYTNKENSPTHKTQAIDDDTPNIYHNHIVHNSDIYSKCYVLSGV